MKVIINDNPLFVGWQYAGYGTKCIVKDTNKETVKEVHIKKYFKDKDCKETARKISLGRLVNEMFPGKEGKSTRQLFWDAYLTRKPAKTETPTFAKLVSIH